MNDKNKHYQNRLVYYNFTERRNVPYKKLFSKTVNYEQNSTKLILHINADHNGKSQ